MKNRSTQILLFLIALTLPITLFAAQQQNDNRTKAQSASFSFAAGGDYGLGGNFQSTVNALGAANINFLFALGDLSYTGGGEAQWCNTLKAKVPNTIIIAGNHDVGESSGGDINKYRQACPFTLGTMTGDYGKQYYFDYPQGAPLARFIAISPGLKGSVNIDYSNGGAGYTFTQQAIDDARAKGIKWIIVGMHKNCITPGTKGCEMGADILKLLIDKRADLILQGHDHVYARTHTLTCFQVNTFDVSCVADNGDDGVHNYGEGSVVVIAGTSGLSLYEIKNVDGEKQYFSKMQADTYGLPKFTVTENAITAQFINSKGGSFSDNFRIGTAGGAQPPAGQPTTPISPAPTNITPTLFCLGGVPCTTPDPTSPATPPGSGTSPSPTSAQGPIGGQQPSTNPNPNPSVSPCPTDATSGIMHNKSKKKKKKSGGFIEQFLKFLLRLIEFILQRLGIQPPTNPGTPNPTPEPTPCLQPEEPTTAPSAEPTQPQQQPSTAPSTEPSTSPSTAPSTGVSQPPTGGGDPTTATCGGSANTPSSPVTGYRLTKCEDFNSGMGAFSAYNGGGGSTVVGGGRKASQCAATGGMLVLTQNADGSTCGGSMDFAQKYGYWEVRMRTYATGSGGSAPHPVLILWPDTNKWADGELDYFESDIGDDGMGVFLHCIGNPSKNCYHTTYKMDITQWHTYGFEWTASGFKGYVDGKEIYSTGGNGSNPNVSMHQTIQLDNLSGKSPATPAKMDVDWVHMYSK